MMKQQSQSSYSETAQTFESTEPSRILQTMLGLSVFLHFNSGIGLIILGIYESSLCSPHMPNYFASITPIFALLFTLLGIVSICSLRNRRALLSTVNAFVSFILGCIILLNESLSFRCTQNEFHKIKYGLCHEFRSATNTCSWFDGDSDTRNKESTIHLNNQETETVEDSTVRRISLGLSVLGVFNSIVMLILLSVVFKMGNPVYLPKKRHKASIVVGNANNAQLACENKTKNLTLCLAEEDEINTYTSKKTIRLKEYYAKRTKTSVAALVSKENSLLAPNRKEMSALIAKSRSETLEIVHSRKGTSARVPSRNETSLKASSRKETSARATSRKETSVKSTNRKATSEIAQTQIVQIDKTKRGQEHKIEKNQQQIEKKLERNRTIIKNYYL